MTTDELINKLLSMQLQDQYADRPETDVRNDLQEKYGDEVWDDVEFDQLFAVHMFNSPVVHVIRRTDGSRGTVAYVDSPRVYFAFVPEITENTHCERQIQKV